MAGGPGGARGEASAEGRGTQSYSLIQCLTSEHDSGTEAEATGTSVAQGTQVTVCKYGQQRPRDRGQPRALGKDPERSFLTWGLWGHPPPPRSLTQRNECLKVEFRPSARLGGQWYM